MNYLCFEIIATFVLKAVADQFDKIFYYFHSSHDKAYKRCYSQKTKFSKMILLSRQAASLNRYKFAFSKGEHHRAFLESTRNTWAVSYRFHIREKEHVRRSAPSYLPCALENVRNCTTEAWLGEGCCEAIWAISTICDAFMAAWEV